MTNKKGIKKRIAWNKGLTKETDERVLKYSLSNKGKKLSEETKRKISLNNARKGKPAWNKGKKLPEMSGEKHPMYGKKHSKKSLLKMSKSLKGRLVWNKGVPHTEEHKENLRKAKENEKERLYRRIGEYVPCFTCGKIIYQNTSQLKQGSYCSLKCSKQKMSKQMKERRKNMIFPTKDSSIEIKIQNFLKQLGIEFFTHQYMKEIEHGYQCDILIPSMNLVIECDGNYWHKYPIGKDIDHIRTKELIEKGFKVLRLWEFEIKAMSLNQFKNKLK